MDSGFYRGIDDSTRQMHRRAGEFTLNLVKVLLQTGTYSQDHPLAKASTADLYGLFAGLTADATEISYLLLSTVDERGVLIDGLLPEPIEIAKTFRGILGDHFLSKFHDYFLRNRIASFTIKKGLSKQEFENFLSIWVAWGQRGRDSSPDNDLSTLFAREGIVHVTVVGMDEVVGGIRHLQWAVKIALSRLRKDISKLPMLRGVSQSTMGQLKAQAVAEVIRPITRTELLCDILLNVDLATEGIELATSVEVEEVILTALGTKSVHDVAIRLMDLLHELKSPNPKTNLVGRDPAHMKLTVERVLRRAFLRLSALDAPEVRSLLVAAHGQGFLGFDDLPKHVQRQVKAGETTNRFIGQADAYLKDFESCQDPKTYLKYLNVLVTVLPELVARGDSALVSGIFEVMLRHLTDDVPPFLGRNRFIQETLQHFETGGFLDGLVLMTVGLPKEQRENLEKAVSLFGAAVVPGLVNHLSGTDDASARKAICSMLARVGEPGVTYMVDELRSHRHAWFTARNLIGVLSEVGSSDALPVIYQYCGHPHPRVREECAQALSRMMGPESEARLLEFLEDREETVVRRAVQALAMMHSTQQKFLKRLADGIRVRSRDEEEPSEALQATCLRALQEYERIILPPSPNFDELLLEMVNPPRLKQMLPGRFGVRRKPDALRALAIDALGTRGSKALQGPLAEMAGSKVPEISDAARRAIARIQRRLSGT